MEAVKEKTKRFVVNDVPEEVHRALRVACANSGITMREAIIGLVRAATTHTSIQTFVDSIKSGGGPGKK